MQPLRTLAAALACAIPSGAAAQTAVTVYSSARPGTLAPQAFREGGEGPAVPGYALVREEREFTLAAGRNLLRVSDVPALIDPTTVAFASLTDPKSTRVVEQSFEFDLTSTSKLLSRFLEREITVEQARGNGVEAVSGTLGGTQGGLILRQPDGSVRVLESESAVRLPSPPGGLSARGPARVPAATRGVTSGAGYSLTSAQPTALGCRPAAAAWLTLVSQSGAASAAARLKLVAADVQRVQARAPAVPHPAAMERHAI